jgi:succinyl-CoA synthetase beta subunit
MLVNGAGLAMATNDTIELLHGKNANFLDAGGKATPETIKTAFRLVLKNPNVAAPLALLTAGQSHPSQRLRRYSPDRQRD